MNVIYKPSVVSMIADANMEAARLGKEIEKIVLTKGEWKRLMKEAFTTRNHSDVLGMYSTCCGIRVEVEK